MINSITNETVNGVLKVVLKREQSVGIGGTKTDSERVHFSLDAKQGEHDQRKRDTNSFPVIVEYIIWSRWEVGGAGGRASAAVYAKFNEHGPKWDTKNKPRKSHI